MHIINGALCVILFRIYQCSNGSTCLNSGAERVQYQDELRGTRNKISGFPVGNLNHSHKSSICLLSPSIFLNFVSLCNAPDSIVFKKKGVEQDFLGSIPDCYILAV